MSAAARAYIASTVTGLTPATWPQHRWVHLDASRGRRESNLAAAVGRPRLFELTAGQPEPVDLAGPSLQAMDERLTLRWRVDAPGPHDRTAALDAIREDGIAIAKALRTSGWAQVAGLAVLNAWPAATDEQTGPDGAALVYFGEVDILISYDV